MYALSAASPLYNLGFEFRNSITVTLIEKSINIQRKPLPTHLPPKHTHSIDHPMHVSTLVYISRIVDNQMTDVIMG